MHLISGFYHRIEWVFEELLNQFAIYFMHEPKVLTVDETIDLIVNKHYSCSRNGDGELNLMMYRDIPFQKKSHRLSKLLREALNANTDRYISCLTDVFSDTSRFNQKAQLYFKHFLHRNRFHWYCLAKAPIYGNAFMSRFYIDYEDKSGSPERVKNLKRIWQDQNVILVEGKDSRLGVGNDLFDNAKSLKRILGPSENAFDKYDLILENVQRTSLKTSLILLALGPTATVMAYELSKYGYWAVDIGHIDIEYEWMLLGATTKVNILGKYTNEATKAKIMGVLPVRALEKYHSEIISEIS